MSRGRELALLALIVVVYAMSLGRSVDYGYVWDDVPEIEHSATLDGPLLDGLALTQVERSDAGLVTPALQLGYDSYRPVVFASYWLDVRLWGHDAGALHRTSVVLGALAILLAYLATRRWLGSAWALVPTALFALHPAQIEAVAYVSARGDLLAGVFAIAALYAALRFADADPARPARAAPWLAAATIAFALSLLAKESDIGLPVALACVLWRRGPRARWWWTVGVLVAVAVGFLAFHAAMVTTHASPPYASALADAASVVIDDLRVVALPFDLSIARAPSGHAVLGWVAAAAALAVIVGARGWSTSTTVPAWLGGLAWAVVLVGPSIVAVETMDVVADRYLYAPMLGLGVAVAEAARAGLARPRLRWPVRIAATAWAAMLVAVTVHQVPVWRDRQTLYAHAVELAPESSSAQYRVAYLDVEAGRWDLAVPRLSRAIALDPFNADALNNLGVYYLRVGHAVEAELLFAQAIAANPAHFRSWLNLGLAQLARDQPTEGCASIARALEIDPAYTAARTALAERCTR